jgi:DNA-binding NtrC family response regulator
MMDTILIVEDKKSMADMLAKAFGMDGFAVKCAHTIKDGIVFLRNGGISVIVTDLRLPDGDGMEIIHAAKSSYPMLPVVVMTAYGSIETAVKAVKEGAYDFITKPFDPEHLLRIVKRALAEKNLQRGAAPLNKTYERLSGSIELIGASPAWDRIMEDVRKVAPLKTTVLILGESGTGKELVARAIHDMSGRSQYPFVAVNCAAIPKDLIESEIFGYEKGAFTGANEAKPGRFELADTGTIFLDEIGDMEMSLQSKLLRVLQESEFEMVGGTTTIKVDVRVIAASNKDLHGDVAAGRFREDLFYRLNVFPIIVPPLRERREDIVSIAEYYISDFCNSMSKSHLSLSEDALKMLLNYSWKGNVRELKNVIERAVILCAGEKILPEHLGIEKGAYQDIDDSLHAASAMAEKKRIINTLKLTGGNKTKAAEILKISYKTLFNKIKEYGII